MKARRFKLGTQKIGGLDYFVVLDCNPKISFREMLDGVTAIQLKGKYSVGAKGGAVKSEAKAEAARENGKKGGRPRKKVKRK